jgi:hypothetical protein
VVLAVRTLSLVVISAGVRVDADRSWDLVEPAVRAALADRFSFDRRELGQDVLLSDVLQAVQAVPGVTYVDVDALGAVSEDASAADLADLGTTLSGPVPVRVPIGLATSDGHSIQPAGLALAAPDIPETILLREITP